MTYRFIADTTCWHGQLVRANSLCKRIPAVVDDTLIRVVILDGRAHGMIATVKKTDVRALSPLEQLAEVSE